MGNIWSHKSSTMKLWFERIKKKKKNTVKLNHEGIPR